MRNVFRLALELHVPSFARHKSRRKPCSPIGPLPVSWLMSSLGASLCPPTCAFLRHKRSNIQPMNTKSSRQGFLGNTHSHDHSVEPAPGEGRLGSLLFNRRTRRRRVKPLISPPGTADNGAMAVSRRSYGSVNAVQGKDNLARRSGRRGHTQRSSIIGTCEQDTKTGSTNQ